MKREIKFRVWTGATMEYNVTVGKFGAFFVNPGAKGDGLDDRDSASITPFNTKYSEVYPVMQYTGLKDKSGKEIYEGDILEISDTDAPLYRAVIQWFEAGFWVTDAHGGHYRPNEKYREVIGNIYENKDLLK